jgi:uncharacterized membrane protein
MFERVARGPTSLGQLQLYASVPANTSSTKGVMRSGEENPMRPGTLRYSNIDMALTARSIDVNAPLRAVYDQWTRFEEFPLFLEGVEEVRLEAEKFLLWKVKIAGKIKDWEAEITNQVPDQEISWESVDGSSNSGTITFEELDPQWTRVTASIGYEPEGILEKTEEVLGITSGRVERDLEQFRDYIQGKAKGSGGWRRRVANENTVETDVLPMG